MNEIDLNVEEIRSLLGKEILNLKDNENNYSNEWKTISCIEETFNSIENIIEEYETSKEAMLTHLNELDMISNQPAPDVPSVTVSQTVNGPIIESWDELSSYLQGTDQETSNDGKEESKPIEDLPITDEKQYTKWDWIPTPEEKVIEDWGELSSYLKDENTSQSTNLRDRGYPSSYEGGIGSKPIVAEEIEDMHSTRTSMNKLERLDMLNQDKNSGGAEDNSSLYGGATGGGGNTDKTSTGVGRNSEVLQSEQTATVNTKHQGLNVRTGKGTDTTIKTSAAKGSTVTILEDDGSGWTKVRLSDGTEGYVASSYLTKNNSSSTNQTYISPPNSHTTSANSSYTSSGMMATVNTNNRGLNLRNSPGMDGSIMTSIPKGTQIEVLGPDQNGWTLVKYGDRQGYVASEWLKKFDSEDNL